MVKGVIRLKCVDLANWAANQGLFNDVSASDPIRFGTEGMETVMVYVQKTENMTDMQQELCDAMDAAIAKFQGMNTDFDMLMQGVKATLNAKVMTQSFSSQLRLPISPYIEVVIKDDSATQQ